MSGIEPEVMGYAPALAIPKALERAGIGLGDVDLVELNEAFAAQAVAVVRDVGLDPETVNVVGRRDRARPSRRGDRGDPHGEAHACARAPRRSHGVVTMCIGGGQGMAAVFERP